MNKEKEKIRQKIRKNEERMDVEKDSEINVMLTEQNLMYQDEIFYHLKMETIRGGNNNE